MVTQSWLSETLKVRTETKLCLLLTEPLLSTSELKRLLRSLTWQAATAAAAAAAAANDERVSKDRRCESTDNRLLPPLMECREEDAVGETSSRNTAIPSANSRLAFL